MTIPSSTNPSTDDPPGSDGRSDPAPSDGSEAARNQAAAASARRARRLVLHFGVVLIVASALAAWVAGPRAGLSAALGVALAGANLLLMQKITLAMTGGDSSGGASSTTAQGGGAAAGNPVWGLALPFKLVALVGVAYASVRGGVAQPVPLAMGFALLPLTGVFLPRPTSVHPHPVPRERLATSHPPSRPEPSS